MDRKRELVFCVSSCVFFFWEGGEETYFETERRGDQSAKGTKSTVLHIEKHRGKDEAPESEFLDRFDHMRDLDFLSTSNGIVSGTFGDNGL